jgi:hypothetical protein
MAKKLGFLQRCISFRARRHRPGRFKRLVGGRIAKYVRRSHCLLTLDQLATPVFEAPRQATLARYRISSGR